MEPIDVDRYVPEPAVLRSLERVDETQYLKDLNAQVEYLRECLKRQERQVDQLLGIVERLSYGVRGDGL